MLTKAMVLIWSFSRCWYETIEYKISKPYSENCQLAEKNVVHCTDCNVLTRPSGIFVACKVVDFWYFHQQF